LRRQLIKGQHDDRENAIDKLGRRNCIRGWNAGAGCIRALCHERKCREGKKEKFLNVVQYRSSSERPC